MTVDITEIIVNVLGLLVTIATVFIIPYIKKNMKDEGLLFNEKVISYDIADEKDDDSFYYTKPMVCGSDFVCNTSKHAFI